MGNIWEFLLQTLTVSLTAAVLLIVKYLLADKLSPRWQYGIWGLLALRALIPAGMTRQVLLPLPAWVDMCKTAAERGLACVLMSGGHSTAEGMTAYTEPCFLPKDHPLASGGRRLLVYTGDSWREVEAPSEESLTGGAGPEGEAECDNSIDVHPYYIRFSGDSGGWLDIVTRERMGEGVVTRPVSVKAMHNWASHAVKFDPEVFFARLIK